MRLATVAILFGIALGLSQPTRTRAADDSADVAFWTSLRNDNPAELQAYLTAFPNGRFAELARIRLRGAAATAPAAAIMPSSPDTRRPTTGAANTPPASVVAARTRLRSVDPVVVDFDARALINGSNHRLIVVPAGSSDAVSDRQQFDRDSKLITTTRARVTLLPGPPGRDEVRMYYIPQFESAFRVAARAQVDVAPRRHGAMPAFALIAEAAATEPIRFEAKYRDQTVMVEGQFLRVQARTTDELSMAALLKGGSGLVQRPYLAVFVGMLGVAPDRMDSPREILCVMPAEGSATINRVAALNPGDPVVLNGAPSTWSSVFGTIAVVMNPCVFAD